MIVLALQHNNTLKLLRLNNNYSDDAKEIIRSLQDKVNMKRKSNGCQVKLDITLDIILHCTIFV